MSGAPQHKLDRLRQLLAARAAEVEAPAVGQVYPQSIGQRSLWFMHRLAPASWAYNVVFAARLPPSLDEHALAGSLHRMVERHPVLRSTFREVAGQAVQEVQAPPERVLEAIDLGAVEHGEAALLGTVRELVRRPFGLGTDLPLRAVLVRAAGVDPALVLLFHHIAVDFWSIGLLVEELDALYPALARGQTPVLPPGGAPYRRHVAEEARELAGERGEELTAFWRERLAGASAPLELATDRPRPAIRGFEGGTHGFHFDAVATAELKALAARGGATLFTLLLAVLAVLLGRLTGRRQLAIGSPVAGRERPEFERTVGYFVNLVPMPATIAADTSFASLLEQVGETVAAALEHGGLPYAELVDRLGLPRDPSRNPLCDVTFALESPRMDRRGIFPLLLGHEGAEATIGGLAWRALPVPQQEGQFDLNFHLLELEREIHGLLSFDLALFEPVTAGRWAAWLTRLAMAAVADPEAPVASLSFLAPAERRRVLLEWNDTAVDLSACDSVARRVVERASTAGGLLAIADGEKQLTYRELEAESGALAGRLRELGVGPDVVVAVLAEDEASRIVAGLAVLRAGGAYLPLDPAYPEERLRFMLRAGRAHLLLTRRVSAAIAPRGEVPVVFLDAPGEAAGRSLPLPEAHPETLAYVIFTSGSTGRPKGVAVSRRALVNLVAWSHQALGVRPGDRLANTFGPAFDPWGLAVWSALAGGAAVVTPPAEARLSGERLGRFFAEARITIGSAPTPLGQAWLEAPPAGAGPRILFLGGERLRARPRPGSATRVLNCYGPTEATVVATTKQVEPAGQGLPTIGRPMTNLRAYVLDRRLEPLPAGIPGALFLAGTGLARGYFAEPALTAAAFLPDPFSTVPGGRLYRTGDLARWLPAGELEFLGRLDEQVKIRGFRIELGEIERALAAIAEVGEAAVVVREVPPRGPELVAYLVVAPGAKPAESRSLGAELRKTLPESMVPSAFVWLESLPLDAHGKVDRRALPAPPARAAGRGEVLRAGLEERIAGVWQEVLGVAEVGATASFFDVGGNSLLLGQVLSRLEGELGRPLTAVELLRYPTVRALAEHLEPASATAGRPRARAERKAIGQHEPIAVIGLAGRFPGAVSVEALWRMLVAGEEGLARFSREELLAAGVPAAAIEDRRYVPVGGALAGVELFAASFFGLAPREAEILDPQHRFFLECCWQAFEDAGYLPGEGDATGVFAGVGAASYRETTIARRPDVVEAVGDYALSLANDKDFLATRVAYLLGLHGPAVAVQTACSTSLVAVHLACQSLRLGECEQALAGGVTIRFPQQRGYRFQPGMILSPDGRCRPFDAAAGGTVGGNGVGVVLLKPLTRALEDGDPVRALIKGSAINNDGAAKVGYTAPGVSGQVAAVKAALAAAGTEPASLSYLEAHGTGTALGDPVEVSALNEVFAGVPAASVALGSIKSNLGHLDAAAGVAGLIKTVLALERETIPATLHFEKPNPEIEFAAGPFTVAAQALPWPRGARPRRAGVSSFGIGGTNAHAVLEEAPPAPLTPLREAELLVLSAPSPEALATARGELAAHLAARPEQRLGAVAYTLGVGRKAAACRAVWVVKDGADAIAALGDDARRLEAETVAGPPSIVFLLPGQGAQSAGMARAAYRSFPVFRREVDRAAELLEPILGLDLRSVLLAPQDDLAAAARLRRTALAQPALFVVEAALARLWQSWGVEADAFLGHSVGEYVAACLAGVLTFEQALGLVAERGRLIESLPDGAMLSVALPEADLGAWLPGSGLDLAAVNAPGQVSLAGPPAAVEALAARLLAAGIEHRRLHTSHAFHSAMLDPCLDAFRRAVERVPFETPRKAYVSNLTGTWIRAEEAVDPGYWVRHLRETVRFADGLATLGRDRLLLEVGPGQTLASFARRTLPGVRAVASMGHPRSERPDLEHLLEATGRLWLAGCDIEWSGLWEERPVRVSLPPTQLERQRYWIDPLPGDQQGVAVGALGAPSFTGFAGTEAVANEGFFRPSWQSSVPAHLLPRAAMAGPWLLFVDELGLGEGLAARLRAAGETVATVRQGPAFAAREESTFTMRPGEVEDLVKVLGALGGAPRRAVHLWGLTLPAPPGLPSAAEARAWHAPGFATLHAFVRCVAASPVGRLERLDVVASGLAALPGGRPAEPLKATLLGPCRVLPEECPGTSARAIDVDLGLTGGVHAVSEQLMGELAAGGGEPFVALRAGERWVQELRAVPLPPEEDGRGRLRRRGTYLITGGLGGVGLELAGALAEAVEARLVLLGRRGLPARERWQEILDATDEASSAVAERQRLAAVRAIEAAGGEVLALAADVTDETSLEAALERARERFGHVDGVIHAAGVAGGGLLETRAPAAVEEVLAAKVDGTLLLAALLAADPPEFFVSCSSLSAHLGGAGQADYVSANSFLETLAASRRLPGAVALAWDFWRGVGMAAGPAARGLDALRPTGGLSTAQGRTAFLRVLASRLDQVAVAMPAARPVQGEAAAATAAAAPARHARPAVGTPYVAPRGELETAVAEIVAELLGLDRVGAHDDFFELGGHSLLGTRVLARIEERLGARIALSRLFAAPTVAALAVDVAADRPIVVAAAPAAAPVVATAQEPEVVGVDQLSDRAVAALLASLGVEEGA